MPDWKLLFKAVPSPRPASSTDTTSRHPPRHPIPPRPTSTITRRGIPSPQSPPTRAITSRGIP
jgi:hypothetical protein